MLWNTLLLSFTVLNINRCSFSEILSQRTKYLSSCLLWMINVNVCKHWFRFCILFIKNSLEKSTNTQDGYSVKKAILEKTVVKILEKLLWTSEESISWSIDLMIIFLDMFLRLYNVIFWCWWWKILEIIRLLE